MFNQGQPKQGLHMLACVQTFENGSSYVPIEVSEIFQWEPARNRVILIRINPHFKSHLYI